MEAVQHGSVREHAQHDRSAAQRERRPDDNRLRGSKTDSDTYQGGNDGGQEYLYRATEKGHRSQLPEAAPGELKADSKQ